MFEKLLIHVLKGHFISDVKRKVEGQEDLESTCM